MSRLGPRSVESRRDETAEVASGLCPGTCLWRPGHNGRVSGRRARCWHRLIKAAGWMTPVAAAAAGQISPWPPDPICCLRNMRWRHALSHCIRAAILPSFTSASSSSSTDKHKLNVSRNNCLRRIIISDWEEAFVYCSIMRLLSMTKHELLAASRRGSGFINARDVLLFTRATQVLAMTLCLSVTNRCSIETSGRIGLVFGMGASVDLYLWLIQCVIYIQLYSPECTGREHRYKQ